MKKSYIVLITLAVFGAGAIMLFQPNKQAEVSNEQQDSTDDTELASSSNDSVSTNTASSTSDLDANALTDGNYTGSQETTPFGDLKISIIVENGKISDITFITLPEDDNHSASLNRQASTKLESQTIAAQSADIDGVSGATYTSDAYIESLQSAIDQAKGA
jgi:uncharacterized protein with FMN-binding domain